MTLIDTPCGDFICADDLPASGECLDQVTAAVIEDSISEASYLLYRMSGRRIYGECTATVRPVVRSCGYLTTCAEHCTVTSIRLGEIPSKIVWIVIDGEYLDPNEYRLIDGDRLVRVDGRWPHCQDFELDLTGEGTFGIRYEYGSPIDPVTRRAAIDLTLELVKLAVPGQPRKLPGNMTSVSRRGVSLSMKDRGEMIREAQSYIESVNQFMAVHNPANQPSTYVYSPDTSPRLHTGGRFG